MRTDAPPPHSPRAQLEALVPTTRAEERARIERAINAPRFSGHGGDALDGLRHIEGPTLGAIARGLPADAVVRWLCKQSEKALSRDRREVLEVLDAAPPEALSRLDARLLSRLDLVGLSPREEGLLVDVVSRLPEPKVREVLRSPNASAIRDVFRRRATTNTEASHRADERHALLVELAHQETRVADVARLEGDPELARALDARSKSLCAGRARPRDAEAALAWLASPEHDEATLGTLARALDARGALDRLIELTPEDARFGVNAPHRGVFLSLLRQRSPEKNLAASESLLKTDFFHRSVTPRQARLAYDLVRSLPLEMQRRFREGERGAWFLKLERALDGRTINAASFRGLDVVPAAATLAASAASEPRASGLEPLEVVDAGTRYAEILAVPEHRARLDGLTRLLGPKPSELNALHAHSDLADIEDPELLRALVRRLDTMGSLEPMLAKLGYEVLLHDDRRLDTLKILAARDPVHLAGHARRRLSLGLLDWSITNGDAFFALHLIKSLPEAERKSFMAENGGRWWKRVEDRLTGGMRRHPATHLYTGGPGGRDQDALRAQLMRPEAWSDARPEQLKALVRMAQAAGDGRFAFEASKAHALHTRHPELVERYGLHHPEHQKTYRTDFIDRVRYLDEGPLGVLNDVAFKLLDTAVVIGKAHLSDFVGVAGLNLDALHGGVRRRRRQLNRGAKLTLKTDPLQGIIEIEAPRIVLNHFDAFRESSRIDARAVAIEGLQVRAHYPTRKNPKPAYLRVELASLEVLDAVVADPDSLRAAAKIVLEDVRYVQASPTESDDALRDQIHNLRLPVPVLGRVSGAIARILDLVFSGGLSAGNARQLGEPLGPTRQGLEIGRAEVTGLLDSQGRGFERLELNGAKLAGGGSLSALLRATDGDEAAIALASDEESELARLEAARRLSLALPPADKARLVELEHKIGHAGYAVEIQRAVVDDVRSGLEARRVTLTGLKGTVDAPTLGFSVIHDPQFLEDLLASHGNDEAWRDASGQLTIASIEVEAPKSARVLPSIESLRAQPDGVPPLREELEGLEAKGLRALTADEQLRYVELSDALVGAPDVALEHVTLEGTRLDLHPNGQRVEVARATAAGLETESARADWLEALELGVALSPAGAEVQCAELDAVGVAAGADVTLDWVGVSQLTAKLERRRAGEGGGLRLTQLEAARVGVGDLQAQLQLPASRLATDAPVRLEPLAGLDGVVTARTHLGAVGEKSEARAELTLSAGQIDPRTVRTAIDFEPRGVLGVLKHVAGRALNLLVQPIGRPRVDARGLVIGPGPFRYVLLDAERNSGLHADRGPRGALDFREWAEHRAATRDAPGGADPDEKPRTVELAAEDLRLGAGRFVVGDVALTLGERTPGNGIDLRATLGSSYDVRARRLDLDDFSLSTEDGGITGGRASLDLAHVSIRTPDDGAVRLEVSLAQGQAEHLRLEPAA